MSDTDPIPGDSINHILSAASKQIGEGIVAFNTILHHKEIAYLSEILVDGWVRLKGASAVLLAFSLDGKTREKELYEILDILDVEAKKYGISLYYISPMIYPEDKITFKNMFGTSPFCGAIALNYNNG